MPCCVVSDSPPCQSVLRDCRTAVKLTLTHFPVNHPSICCCNTHIISLFQPNTPKTHSMSMHSSNQTPLTRPSQAWQRRVEAESNPGGSTDHTLSQNMQLNRSLSGSRHKTDSCGEHTIKSFILLSSTLNSSPSPQFPPRVQCCHVTPGGP